MRHYTMAFTHKYTEIYPGKGKTNFLRASLALFVSFIALYKMFTIQYKVSTNLQNLNSKTRIRKPWAEKPNTMDYKTAHHNTVKNSRGQTPCKEYNINPTSSSIEIQLVGDVLLISPEGHVF